MVYWLLLLVISVSLIFTAFDIFIGQDPRGSKHLREKLAMKNKWLTKLVILKPKDKEPILIIDFIPYFVSLIHLAVTLPVYIVFWATASASLTVFFDSLFYVVYTIGYITIFAIYLLACRIIDLLIGQKEYKNKHKK